jgi:hypothetical protein
VIKTQFPAAVDEAVTGYKDKAGVFIVKLVFMTIEVTAGMAESEAIYERIAEIVFSIPASRWGRQKSDSPQRRGDRENKLGLSSAKATT